MYYACMNIYINIDYTPPLGGGHVLDVDTMLKNIYNICKICAKHWGHFQIENQLNLETPTVVSKPKSKPEGEYKNLHTTFNREK